MNSKQITCVYLDKSDLLHDYVDIDIHSLKINMFNINSFIRKDAELIIYRDYDSNHKVQYKVLKSRY